MSIILNTPPQVQRYGKNVELGTQEGKPGGRQWFGQKIRKLVLCGNKPNQKRFGSHHVRNKMEVNFNVFGSGMKDQIYGVIGGSNVVTPKNRGRGK